MTQIPGPAAGPTADTASGLDRFFDWLRSIDLRRDGEEKWLAGVCSGIATRLGVDPIVIRAALVLLVLMGGIGITIYLIAWAFIPNNREEIVAERAIRQGDVLGIILLVVIGLSLIGGPGMGHDNGLVWFWWVAIPVVVVVWLVTRHRDGRPGRRDGAPQGTTGYAGGAGPAAYAPAPGTTAWAPSPTATAGPTAPGAAAPTTGPEPMAYAAPPTTTATAEYPAGPPQGPVPPAPVAPRRPRPPRPPRRRSAGFVGALLVGGVALAVYGLTLWLHDSGHWPGSDETVALAAALAVFGVALVGFGLAGLRAGLTAFIAILLALSTWTASVVPNLNLGGGVGDRVWRPAATDTTPRYRLGIGSAELDLTDAANDPTTPARIDARVGIGELRIRIPKDLTVQVRGDVNAGDISRTDPTPDLFPGSPTDGDLFNSSSTVRDGRDVSTTETFGSGTPDVVVDAHVGLGQILIGKE